MHRSRRYTPRVTPPDPTRRARSRAPRRLAAAVAGVVFALLLAEAAFRIAGVGGPPGAKCVLRREGDLSVEYHLYPTNPSGKFAPVPAVTGPGWHLSKLFSPPVELPLSALGETPWCVEYRRESFGVRGPAVNAFAAPGVVRIAGIGDSFALGEGVPYEETLFARLAPRLFRPCEVLNFAVSGIDTEGYQRALAMMVPSYNCSRAIVVLTLNDVPLAPAIRHRMGEVYDLVNLRAAQMDSGARPWYRRASRLAEFVASAAEVRAITRETEASYLDAYDLAKNGENLALVAARLQAMAHVPACPVAVVIYPMMYRLEGKYPLQPCHDALVRMAKDAGLPVLDLAPAFAGEDSAALQVHPLDHHPNGRAHEIAAEAIADWIRSQPAFWR